MGSGRGGTGLVIATMTLVLLIDSLDASIVQVALPEMSVDLGMSVTDGAFVVVAYLFPLAGLCIPLSRLASDGRVRAMLVLGTVVFTAASVGCAMSGDRGVLIAFRFVQGLGAAVGQVVSQAMVRDRWSGAHAAAMNGMIAMFFALSPALAPILGGWIVLHGGWHYVFVFLVVYSCAIALYTVFAMPETLPKEKRVALTPLRSASLYKKCFAHKAFMAGVISHGFCFMGGIVYSAGAADFVITIMGLGVDQFAWLTLPLVGTSIIGAWLSAKVLKRLHHGLMLALCMGLMIAAQLASAAIGFAHPLVFPCILIGPVLYWLGMSLARPVMMAMNLDYFADNRGLAASVQQFFCTASFSLCPLIWVPLVLGEAWKYSAASAFCGLVVLALWRMSMRERPAALEQAGQKETMT